MSRKTVLLVDDTNLFLHLEKTFLKRSNINILTANNGLEAIELTKKHSPDVIFLDLNMPLMDGDECCRLIKQDNYLKDIIIVMVTTKGRHQDIERCRNAGCDDILLKPINRSEFVATAHKFMQLPIRSERFKAKIPVHYGKDSENILTDFCVDISSGGLFVKAEQPMMVDDTLDISFTLPDPKRLIECSAKVAWVNSSSHPIKKTLPSGMGIRFVNLGIGDLHAIRNFLMSNSFEPSW